MDDNSPVVIPHPAVFLLSPEQITGPHLKRPDLIRRNISEGADGIPLILRLTIVDAMTSEPVTDALVDIWHCNMRDTCSGWNDVEPQEDVDVLGTDSIPCSDGNTYLRGGQFTDHKGNVRFTTIYPGFYAGRVLHIHLAVRMVSGTRCQDEEQVAWVGKLYFPETVSRSALNAREYRGLTSLSQSNRPANSDDSRAAAASTLTIHTLGRDTHEDGFFGHLSIGIDTFAVSTHIKPEDFDKYTV
ncbi:MULTISPECIES: intradiol ring-cleavage dioxygenase [unclassified Pseudomonas]|uniref:intradiol ring-cleavage dioxygenase n=1 Tax=unclassified Pseudomonas TaxID=196821 RepID=UPI002AC95B80|nr:MULTISPECIES: intradiol ring-cleavage dioxygenase [unclassified Pseudomonas]MEB0046317.1 intradiol ring-cleavage dioxygenase [Pseudomonas sp. Dout3]MEB0097758.1 intradiol ring-cleavage dioxygenase [Pseudomonas sp. DC1.2]WPX57658.1 intradiol ring-cleavage dioxygenase [Pseudomonas sp. DC1.2]